MVADVEEGKDSENKGEAGRGQVPFLGFQMGEPGGGCGTSLAEHPQVQDPKGDYGLERHFGCTFTQDFENFSDVGFRTRSHAAELLGKSFHDSFLHGIVFNPGGSRGLG